MKRNAIRLAGALLTLCIMAGANAASISLVATSPTAGLLPGDIVSFDVVMDFTTDDNGLGSDITLGGGFDIVFDESFLQFEGLSNAGLGDPAFGRDPDVLPGLLESWGFADFNGLTGPALVGSVQFSVLATGPASSFVSTAPTNGIAGPFVSAVDFISILNVDYNSIEVTRIPVPAAVWFMLSGLVALFGMRRAA